MIITYNHAKYIAEAIDSVLAQKTDFPFAIHVIDDCSTDGAQDIIRDYAARFPGVVKPFINKKNIGAEVTQKNFYRGFCTLDGDYIAFLEGDDYWTSPNRLQTHVAFLEAHPDYVACANDTLKVYDDGSRPAHVFMQPPQRDTHDIDDVISLTSVFHASSLTFRNVFRGRVPRYLSSRLSCDIFITVAHAQFGKIRYFPHAWSVYRAHSGGLFSSMTQTHGWMWNIDGMRACNRWLGYRYLPQFAKAIYRYCNVLLADGLAEDGLTPEKRGDYEAIGRRYRAIDKALRRLELVVAKWIPGVRAKSAPARLNLGCGAHQDGSVINVDKRADVDPDMVVDLERTPWPWPDNYAQEVYFLHSLEHMGRDFETLERMMRELYRVARPGARIFVRAKHPRSDAFIDDPTCVRVVSPPIMSLFDARAKPNRHLGPVAQRNKVDFEMTLRRSKVEEPYWSQLQRGEISRQQIERLMRENFNICSAYTIEMTVHKPPRPPLEPEKLQGQPEPERIPVAAVTALDQDARTPVAAE